MRTLISGCLIASLILTAACGFALPLRAAEPPPANIPVPALAAMDETFQPGLKLTIESGGAKDTRVARIVAFRVPPGSPPSPFMPPGAFKATWEGVLTLRIKDEYTFKAEGSGALKLTINDAVALDVSGADLSATSGPPVKLKKGKNILRAEYTSLATGEASIRLFWFGKAFISESVPTTVFSHDAADH
ncbi:MAG: PA14 domain-containing protein, partial [Tepidisphaeraceae bacterium]